MSSGPPGPILIGLLLSHINQVPGPQPATEFDMDKVKTTIKQFVRDWSADGKHEREACYKPVLDEIEELFPPDRWFVTSKACLEHEQNYLNFGEE